MSKRLPPKLWKEVVQRLANRDGSNCKGCGQPLPQPLDRKDVPRRQWTTINHRDGNKDDYRPENIELMHLSCNISHFHALNRKARAALIMGAQQAPDQASVTGERANTLTSLPGFRIVPAREGDSFSNRKNQECQPVYYREVFKIMLHAAKVGRYHSYDEINDAVAMYVGEVPSTTGRYLNMLKSVVGPLDEVPTKGGKLVLVFRKPYYSLLDIGQLMSCWPPSGIRSVDSETRERILREAEEKYDAVTMAEIDGLLKKHPEKVKRGPPKERTEPLDHGNDDHG